MVRDGFRCPEKKEPCTPNNCIHLTTSKPALVSHSSSNLSLPLPKLFKFCLCYKEVLCQLNISSISLQQDLNCVQFKCTMQLQLYHGTLYCGMFSETFAAILFAQFQSFANILDFPSLLLLALKPLPCLIFHLHSQTTWCYNRLFFKNSSSKISSSHTRPQQDFFSFSWLLLVCYCD